jgi:hypothetical protein
MPRPVSQGVLLINGYYWCSFGSAACLLAGLFNVRDFRKLSLALDVPLRQLATLKGHRARPEFGLGLHTANVALTAVR